MCNVELHLVSLLEGSTDEAALNAEERERARRMIDAEHRTRWIRCRLSLRKILSTACGIAPEDLRFEVGQHGKPEVVGAHVRFNLSHSSAWAMIAVTRGIPVGIDIERIRHGVDIAALLRRIGETELPRDQHGLFQKWTRREAISKAAGGPLMVYPEGIFHFADLSAPEGYCASVALNGTIPVCGPVTLFPATSQK